jgi:hypothetical protein
LSSTPRRTSAAAPIPRGLSPACSKTASCPRQMLSGLLESTR